MDVNGELKALRWRKSSHSGPDDGDYIEVADGVPDVVPVRDSRTSCHLPAST